MGLIGESDSGDDLLGDGEAEIGAKEGGFEFGEGGAGEPGRARDDTLDLVAEGGGGPGDGGLQFVEESHGTNRSGWRRGDGSRATSLEGFDLGVGKMDGPDEGFALGHAMAV